MSARFINKKSATQTQSWIVKSGQYNLQRIWHQVKILLDKFHAVLLSWQFSLQFIFCPQ